MDRRSFLGLFGAAGVTAAVDRKYFFAPKKGWIAKPGDVYAWSTPEELLAQGWNLKDFSSNYQESESGIFIPAHVGFLPLTLRGFHDAIKVPYYSS